MRKVRQKTLLRKVSQNRLSTFEKSQFVIKIEYYKVKVMFTYNINNMNNDMNNDMIIKETNVWGHFHNVRNVNKRLRLMKKREIINCYPFVDHYMIYAYKPKSQKGPAREEQTFIISYTYNYDSFANEDAFITKLNEIGLLFYKEKCLYKNKDAYKIIIYENICQIDVILPQI